MTSKVYELVKWTRFTLERLLLSFQLQAQMQTMHCQASVARDLTHRNNRQPTLEHPQSRLTQLLQRSAK
jgi:hypothetical protein